MASSRSLSPLEGPLPSPVDVPPSIIERIVQASKHGGTLGISGVPERRAYADLLEEASVATKALHARDIGPGSRVGAVAEMSFEFVVAMLATWLAGATFVPLPPPSPGRAGRWPSEIEARLTVARVDQVINTAAENRSRPTFELPEKTLDRDAPPSGVAEGQALIQFSSGTTSSARGVWISHESLIAQVDAHARRARLADPTGDHAVSWLPLNHDFGFIAYLIRPLAVGVGLTLVPTERFLRSPLAWPRAIADHAGTHSSAPSFAFGMLARALEKETGRDVDLSSWRHASIGGESIDVKALETFERAAAPFGFDSRALAPGYGLAEATCSVSLSLPGQSYIVDGVDRDRLMSGEAVPSRGERKARFVSVGQPLSGVNVRIEANGATQPERMIGEILVRAPFLMSGYVNDEPRTNETLQEGWLRTGDLGYKVGEEVFITGRLKDVIVLRGQNLYAEDVERVVHQIGSVRSGGVAALSMPAASGEQLVIAAETLLTDVAPREECRRAISRTIWREVGVYPDRVVLLPPGSLPKTSSGKMQRKRTSELLGRGILGE